MAEIETTKEEQIQALANILSLLAIVGGMDNAAVQRVLVSLGSTLINTRTTVSIDRELAFKLVTQISAEKGEEATIQIMRDLNWVAEAWQPVIDAFAPFDPYRPMPYGEIIDLLVNYSGVALQDFDAFVTFGGPDLVLPMAQLTSALRSYAIPAPGLSWDFVGFDDPPDQALVAGDARTMFLFKTHATDAELRFSELGRDSIEDARSEHDIRVDSALFGAFVAGLLGDMLYWAARLRAHSLPGQEIWKRLQNLLTSMSSPTIVNMPKSAPAPEAAQEEDPEPDEKEAEAD